MTKLLTTITIALSVTVLPACQVEDVPPPSDEDFGELEQQMLDEVPFDNAEIVWCDDCESDEDLLEDADSLRSDVVYEGDFKVEEAEPQPLSCEITIGLGGGLGCLTCAWCPACTDHCPPCDSAQVCL